MKVYFVTSLVLIMTSALRRCDGDPTMVYSWVQVDYDWPNDTAKQLYIDSQEFIIENNIISGIKVYKDDVFLTVPRWRSGVPSSLNRVVLKDGKTVLQPYPSWKHQAVGDCEALQYVQSMEVDPNTGLMWIIDNGRIDISEDSPRNLCPPKLVIYNIKDKKEVLRYTFPREVADPSSCFLNDLVLDYVNGAVQFAYITDTRDAKLYVYDYARNTSYYFKDPSMQPEFPGVNPIDGIAMSADFNFVYYCALDSKDLYQIPTSVLRKKNANFSSAVRRVGTKLSRSDGLAYGHRSLFYGLLDLSGLQRWKVAVDAQKDGGYALVSLSAVDELLRDNVTMLWVDTLAWDDSGYLWFTANNLKAYFAKTMNFSAQQPNMRVWKKYIDEKSYLSGAASSAAALSISVDSVNSVLKVVMIFFCSCYM